MEMDKFKEYVNAAHGEQMYGTHPYSYHLEMVLAEVAKHTSDPYTLMAAYGHDLFEDTPEGANREAFIREHGKLLHDVIDRLTDRPGANRRERHIQTYWRIREDHRALLVKLADRKANHQNTIDLIGDHKAQSLARMYRKEYWEFKFALYKPGMYDSIWGELDEQYKALERVEYYLPPINP